MTVAMTGPASADSVLAMPIGAITMARASITYTIPAAGSGPRNFGHSLLPVLDVRSPERLGHLLRRGLSRPELDSVASATNTSCPVCWMARGGQAAWGST